MFRFGTRINDVSILLLGFLLITSTFGWIPSISRLPQTRYLTAGVKMSIREETQVLPSKKLILKGLQPSSFAHPLDTQLRNQLSRIPFVEVLLRQLFNIAEKTIVLELLSSSVKVGPDQMASLHHLLRESCAILDMEQVPDLYISSNPVPNAYTLAVNGKKSFIVLHSSIVDMLTQEEIQAVIAHECGHLKCEHGLWVTLLNIIIQGLGEATLVAVPLQDLLLRWQRSAEYSCDRAALLVTQDVNTVASVFLKLSGGNSQFSKELSVASFLKQAEEFEKEKKSENFIAGRLFTALFEERATHPLSVQRVKELNAFFKSAAYKGLLERARVAQHSLNRSS